jgi:HSP20 family protein
MTNALRLFNSLDDLMRPYVGSTLSRTGGEWFSPTCDLKEDKKQYVMKFDLPGVAKEDIKIELLENQLVVTGEKKSNHESDLKDDSNVFHLVERVHGSFRRSFSFPVPVQNEKIEAVYKDGVLTVTVHKADTVKPQRIEIH